MIKQEELITTSSTSFTSTCVDVDENSLIDEEGDLYGLKFNRVIGEGAWGTVWHATNPSGDESYAVKVMSKHSLLKERQQDHAHRERKILPKLDHPFIVSFTKFYQDTR